jgi:hypothetical protein
MLPIYFFVVFDVRIFLLVCLYQFFIGIILVMEQQKKNLRIFTIILLLLLCVLSQNLTQRYRIKIQTKTIAYQTEIKQVR